MSAEVIWSLAGSANQSRVCHGKGKPLVSRGESDADPRAVLGVRDYEQRAEIERDPSIKRQLLEEARRWLALAEYVESQGR